MNIKPHALWVCPLCPEVEPADYGGVDPHCAGSRIHGTEHERVGMWRDDLVPLGWQWDHQEIREAGGRAIYELDLLWEPGPNPNSEDGYWVGWDQLEEDFKELNRERASVVLNALHEHEMEAA